MSVVEAKLTNSHTSEKTELQRSCYGHAAVDWPFSDAHSTPLPDKGIPSSQIMFLESFPNHENAIPPGNHNSPCTPNGSVSIPGQVGFKSGKVTPSPLDSASPPQWSMQKGARKRAQGNYDSVDVQTRRGTIHLQRMKLDTTDHYSVSCFDVQKVCHLIDSTLT